MTPAKAAMARLVKVMEVPPTVKVRPLEKPRPDTKMTAAKYSSDRDTLRVECKSAVFHADFLLLRPSRCCNSMGSAAS